MNVNVRDASYHKVIRFWNGLRFLNFEIIKKSLCLFVSPLVYILEHNKWEMLSEKGAIIRYVQCQCRYK